MGSLAPLKKKFGTNKRFTRLVAVRKPCPLGFNELVVYSTLIFRAKESGMSARKISLLTGFHQSVTTPKILATLRGHGLVVQSQDKLWSAVAPDAVADWFALQPAEELANRFRYNWISVPADGSPLTPLHAAIIPQLVLGKSHAQISRWLRVSLKTVGRVAKMLQDNGNKFNRSWFQDKGVVEKKAPKQPVQEQPTKAKEPALPELLGVTDRYIAIQIDRSVNYAEAGGLTPKQARQFFADLVGQFKNPNGDNVYDLLSGFAPKFDKVKADHNHNRSNGKAYADNCYHLLRKEYGI